MSTEKLSNISLQEYRTFLIKIGCKQIRSSGGHEVWAKKELTRPIVFQSHIEPFQSLLLEML